MIKDDKDGKYDKDNKVTKMTKRLTIRSTKICR